MAFSYGCCEFNLGGFVIYFACIIMDPLCLGLLTKCHCKRCVILFREQMLQVLLSRNFYQKLKNIFNQTQVCMNVMAFFSDVYERFAITFYLALVLCFECHC